MQPAEPILIVSHTFPPYRGIGGRRWAKLAKELARRGHPVHVVHADQGKDLMGSLWKADVRHERIHTYPLPKRYPTVLMKRPLTSAIEKLAYHYWLKRLPKKVHGNMFDRSVMWGPVLLPKCHALIAEHGIRHVIATAPPFALLHQLLALKTGHNIQLVADFRDPWTWGELYGRSTMSAEQRAAEDRLEADVIDGYDAVVTPSPYILDHLRKAHPAQATKITLLDHVIDPDELAIGAKLPPDGTFRIVYAGSIYNEVGFKVYFREVLKAFVAVQKADPERWRNIQFRLMITGHGTADLELMVKDAGQQDRIGFHAPLPTSELALVITKSDLVLAYMPPEKRDFVSTKFKEIAYLRTPILHVGEPGGLSQHIVSNGLGATMRVEDVAAQLPSVLSGERVVQNEGRNTTDVHLLSAVAGKLLTQVLR
ncbi:MAG: glycosyltransferase [Flavobacteriales bacterium]|nr:glycosyltransferase [Flavobacteriales bacterium]